MQTPVLFLLLLAACTAKPDATDSPPASRSRLEGLKAVANCSSTLQNEDRITLVGEATETESGPAIRFALVNRSGQTMRLYPFQLPWGNPNSVEIAATSLRGEVLAVVRPIADPGPEEPLALEPAKRLTGDFHLADRIPDVRQAHTEEIVVAWCYSFTPIGESKAHKLTGVVVVPRLRSNFAPGR